ncbi:MAG: acylneuraminate cytidylyltransferase family protein [Anaerolineaceae bacterium]|nr:acylneuraminate cytidylyltransferase family protein [Anaerolineaceae bacterium]
MDRRIDTLKTLAIIPARGGSKGVPRKNIRPVGGKPLIAYTIEAVLQVRDLIHRVIVSTDDAEIAEIARVCGAEVPFLRPAELAGDRAPTLPVLQHAVRFVEDQDQVRMDWVLLLQPTTPFRAPEDIRHVVELASSGGCDSVISVVQVYSTHPILMKRIEGNQLVPYCIEEKEGTRRQDYQPPAYMRNGAIYMSRRDTIMEKRSIWGETIRPYVMPEERSVNIDSQLDFKLAEFLIQDLQARAQSDEGVA